MPTLEEHFYGVAALEVHNNNLSPAIWGKAMAVSLGDKEKIPALYIKLRVEQLIREFQAALTAAATTGQEIECPFCRHRGKAKRVERDAILSALGLIFKYRYSCSKCGQVYCESSG